MKRPDVVLVGAGIMSATLAILLKNLAPSLSIEIFERLDQAGLESSNAWNNAGTGHAANCELNYTPERSDGSIDISKALEINTEYDLSRELWAYLVEQGQIGADFIHSVPHMSFVRGKENAAYLKKRYAALAKHHCYLGMEYTEDLGKLAEWTPLLAEGRSLDEKIAATRIRNGTDVDFGALTRQLFAYLQKAHGIEIQYNHTILDVVREQEGLWRLDMAGTKANVVAPFVFIGAGGGTLPLLQKSKIPSIRGYAGFPVSGIWLRCDEGAIAKRHHAKVYGKASVGSPPMSVPHLDTRLIEGKRSLLFGPYAGFSTKFLKEGSYLDLFKSIKMDNIGSLLCVAKDNIGLIKYLVMQVLQTSHGRFETLRDYYPRVQEKDWHIEVAGQRVQIIKPRPQGGAVLQFGTELVHSQDGSLVGLLGASPGASTAAYIALELLRKCFPQSINMWRPKLKAMIPSYGESLITNAELCRQARSRTAAILHLNEGP